MSKKYFINKSEIYLNPKKRKKCFRCGKRKPQDKFFKKCYSKTGISTICKECNKEISKKFRIDNPEYNKNYNEKNKEFRLNYDKYRDEKRKEYNKERRKNYYEKNRDKELEYAKNYIRGINGKPKN
jgi:hypothetical protein